MSDERSTPAPTEIRDKAADRCRSLAGQVEDCIWLLEPDSERYLFVSAAAAGQWGMTVEAAESRSLAEALAPDSLVKVRLALEERLARYQSGDRTADVLRDRLTVRQLCRNGLERDFEWTTLLGEDPGTGNIELVGISHDVTDRRLLKDDLQRLQMQVQDMRVNLQQLEIERMNLANELASKNRLLGEIVIRDEMTGLYNRQFLSQRAQEEIDRSTRYGTALSMLIFELDDFKRMQESWGYEVSDRILNRVANMVASHIRKPDILARWGGESFAILMPHTTVESGQRSAERMRRVISDMSHPDVGTVTASFGVAERGKGETHSAWFRNIDRAVQEARNLGGNQVRGHMGMDMGAPAAPARYAWQPAWESGNRQIDRQHRDLLDMANDMMDMSLIGSSLDGIHRSMQHLLAHIQHHFWDEERILGKLGWPELDLHAQLHVDLLEEASRFEERLLTGEVKSSAVFSFITEAVINRHLLKEDMKYFPTTRAASPDLTAD